MKLIGINLFSFLVTLSIWCGIIWLTGSVITSGVKTGTKDCDKVYPIEKVVSGDWFCAK